MTAHEAAGERILDPVRQKQVSFGAEEAVRQKIIAYLTGEVGVPHGLIAVERAIDRSANRYRADIIAYERDGKPWMLIECKAPEVEITQRAFDQIGAYNRLIRAPYLLVTNGRRHYCCRWNGETGGPAFLEQFPLYPPREPD